MKAIVYRIRLLEPTLATALDGDPNSAVSYGFLPGSMLRGAIIGKYLQQKNLSELDLTNTDHRRLFFDSTNRFLNGYLVSCLEDSNAARRSLPVLLSLMKEKGENTKFQDFAHKVGDLGKQWQAASGDFCLMYEGKVSFVSASRHVSIHTMRDRVRGRAIEESGAVFRYDSLAQDQMFEAVILCKNDNDAEELRSLMNGTFTIGGSTSAGYGRTCFEQIDIKDDWKEYTLPASQEADPFVLTLLSDTLIRDNNGQHTIDSKVFEQTVKNSFSLPGLTLDRAYLRGRTIGGFNRKWGLPLPQATALQMGSVFVFSCTDCPEKELKRLEWHGIGERRVEGFGRIAVNWHGHHSQLTKFEPADSTATTEITINDGESKVLAERMTRRMLRRKLDESLFGKVQSIVVTKPPSKSQLSRLRSIIRDELFKETPNLDRVSTYCNGLNHRSTSRKQFEDARIGQQNLLAWMLGKLQLMDEQQWADEIGFVEDKRPSLGAIKATSDEPLRNEYLLRLIDGVLEKAIKEKRGS